MPDFTISSLGREDIIPVNKIVQRPELIYMPASESHYFKSDFGDLSFQAYRGKGFEIWYSNYFMRKRATLIGTADIPVLEFQLPFQDNFRSVWDGFGTTQLREKQCQVSYAPFVNNKAFFEPRHYSNLDIHWHLSFLEPFAAEFPLLDQFINKVLKKQPADLSDVGPFVSLDMERLIRAMIICPHRGIIADRFYESAVTLILIELLERLTGIYAQRGLPTPSDIDIVAKAKQVFLAKLEVNYTIPELAKKVGTNVYQLKTAFKRVHGTTVFKYSQQLRIEKAKQLLLDTNDIIQTIAEMVGYTEGNNFSDTFKRVVGCTPGNFRKRR